MADSAFKGKAMKSVASDVVEGYISVNPLFLKKFDKDMVKELYENLSKSLTSLRTEKIDLQDQAALRTRNMKLQRIHNAIIIVRNSAREKKIPL